MARDDEVLRSLAGVAVLTLAALVALAVLMVVAVAVARDALRAARWARQGATPAERRLRLELVRAERERRMNRP
jgi:hypothetical protein